MYFLKMGSLYEKPTVLHELSYILSEAMRKEEKQSLFRTPVIT